MRALLVMVLAACSSAPVPPTTPRPIAADSELSPVLEGLGWLPGDWQGDEGSEHWIAAGGAIYGVALQANGMYEVMIIDDGDGHVPADGIVRLIAMPGGSKAVEFRASTLTVRSARFDNPAHDAPKHITYQRTPDGLKATLDADANRQITFAFRPTTRQPAPELEAADRAFSARTGARGIEGWMAAFAPDGGMIKNGARIEGAAIREHMAGLLATGILAWVPIASGRSGTIGFTIGKGKFTAMTPADSWESTYATIWKQQPDGTWKVLFDAGRAINTP